MGVNCFQVICDIKEADERRGKHEDSDFSQPDCKIIELQIVSKSFKTALNIQTAMQLTHVKF